MSKTAKVTTTVFILMVCLQPAYSRAEDSAEDTAKKILGDTGVTGGLVVHVGCGDGKLTAALRAGDSYLVQGLCTDANKVEQARQYIHQHKLYGPVSVRLFDGKHLPYIDNLVNLVVVNSEFRIPKSEIHRILAPQGVAYIRKANAWEKIVKPRPTAMDEWTHYMYDSTGNAVSHDTLVAPPQHLQWVAGPRWARHHDHMSSMNAMVSAGGRVFYVFDEGSTVSIMLPSKWRLIARDAFSGVVLWKKSIPEWWTRFAPLKSGPAQLPRKLVATYDHVYVPIGLNAPVSQLDAVTGKKLQTYEETENTWEMVLNDGLLYAVTGSPRKEEEKVMKHLYEKKIRAPGNPFNKRWKGWNRKLVTINTETGQAKWRINSVILPGTLAVAGDSTFFHNGKSIVAIDKKTGQERWTSEPVAAIDPEKGIPTGFMPSLAVNNGVVVFAGGPGYGQHMKGSTDKMTALSAKNGKILWESPHYPSGYQSPEDLLAANGIVLAPFTTWLRGKGPDTNKLEGANLKTGKIVHNRKPDVEDPVWFVHHRCHPSKATVNYFLPSKEGVEFVDLKNWRWKIHHWIRGACLYGIMPANGLLYAPMHNCACSADMKLCGFNAVASAKTRQSAKVDVTKHLLTKGPAYNTISNLKSEISNSSWPTYRHDAARSGVASCKAPSSPKKAWKSDIGGKLSAPVMAGGRIYVAAVDHHTLHVLNEDNGAELWTFTAEGRIDSPPTIYKGMVLFGSRDGCVYCLRASDGALVWRFRAVAEDHRLTAMGQVESVWPVHGSILIRDGEAWFVAGRSAFLDGGLQMYRLKPETGKVLSSATFDGKAPDGSELTGAEQKRLIGLPDILSASDGHIFMRAGAIELNGNTIEKRLLPENHVIRYPGGGKRTKGHDIKGKSYPHLFSSYGFLDDSWMHRSYWVYNDTYSYRHGYFLTGRSRPAGRILVCDNKNVYGFGRQQKYFNWTTPMEYRLFARAKSANWKKALIWEKNSPGLLARAMVLAGDTLFAAGPPDVLDENMARIRYEDPQTRKKMEKQADALEGRCGAILMALSRKNGKIITRTELDSSPVWDGMIAANGRLLLSMENGSVVCFGK